MKRAWAPWLIIAGVLVPFSVLVGLGLYFTRAEPPLPQPQIPVRAGPTVEAGPPVALPAPPPPVVVAVAPVADAGPPPLAAPLRAIDSEARRCLMDASQGKPVEVEVQFTPLRDGGYARVHASTQDPMLAACLEDVFEELGFDAAATTDFAPVTHVFRFDPAGP